jgi:hypothetical protein
LAQYLGTIHQLAGLSGRERTLAVFDTALVEARSSDLAALGRLIGGAPGAAAMRRESKRRANKSGAEADPQAFADAHDKNRLIPITSIARATLTRTKMRLYRELVLTLSDGSTETFSWQPGHNKDKLTVPLLRSALGPRLESF